MSLSAILKKGALAHLFIPFSSPTNLPLSLSSSDTKESTINNQSTVNTHTHTSTPTPTQNSPVMSIIKWKTLEEVAYRANNTPYGLAAGVWSTSADTIQYLSRTLKAGSVFVNCYNIFDAALPFGGMRPGMYCDVYLFIYLFIYFIIDNIYLFIYFLFLREP